MDAAAGDLYDYFRYNTCRNNDICQHIATEMCESITCLIDKNKVYTDLKLDNILYNIKNDKVFIKLGDLGSITNLNNSHVPFEDGIYDENMNLMEGKKHPKWKSFYRHGGISTYTPPEMWFHDFDFSEAPCSVAVQSWLIALVICKMFDVFDKFSYTRSDKHRFSRPSDGLTIFLREENEMKTMVKNAIDKGVFGKLNTTNLVACFSVNPHYRPPVSEILSKTKWVKK